MQKINLDFFENIIIYKALTSEKYLATVIGSITPTHFKDKNIKLIFSIIKDFYLRRSTVPTITELKTFIIDNESKEAFKTVVQRFTDLDKNLNEQELLENTERYIKERSIWSTILDISKDIADGKIDTSFILDKFEKSCNVNLKTNVGLDLFKDLNVLIDDLNTEQPVISTGYKFLDKKIGGGWLKNGRAVYIFAGETNVGKSIFLGNFATNIANQNKTVLLITLEMSELVYAKRLISGVSKIPISELKAETQTLRTQIEEHSKGNPNSKLIIKEFPPSTITPIQLQSFIKEVINTGVHIDAIVLDYINLLRAPNGDNSYEKVKIITEQVRALTYIFNCPLISATQLNRSGYDVEKPGLESISESIGLAATADFIGIISQSDEDRELNITRLHLAKNRFGQNYGTTTLRIDYKTLSIYEDESIENLGDLSENIRSLQSLSS